MDAATEKFMSLKERVKTVSDQKIRLEERFKAETAQLEKLIKDITDKGYDPKKLSDIRKDKEAQLTALIQDLEKRLGEAEKKISEINAAIA